MKKAIFRTSGWDLLRETAVHGFAISVSQPEGSNIRIIFEVDGALYFFIDGELAEYLNDGAVDDILEFGNSCGELLDVSGVVEWVGKKVYPIIAMSAPSDADVMPRINLRVRVECYNDEFTRDVTSPVFELKRNKSARITNATFNRSNTGSGVSTSQIRLRDEQNNWTDWVEYFDAISQPACAVQFKNHYVVTTLDGSDSAKIFDCKVEYITDADNLPHNVQEIILKPVELEYDASVCYVLIKHSKLIDAQIKAYIKYQTQPLKRENLIIGKGSGSSKKFFLGVNGGVDRNVRHQTLKLNVGEYEFDTANCTVTLTAEEGFEVIASYEYGADDEKWLEMAFDSTKIYDGDIYATRFIHRSSNDNKKISAVKIQLIRKTGSAEEEIIDKTLKLNHHTVTENISCDGVFIFDEDAQIITTNAEKISYDYVGELPVVEEVIAGWSF